MFNIFWKAIWAGDVLLITQPTCIYDKMENRDAAIMDDGETTGFQIFLQIAR